VADDDERLIPGEIKADDTETCAMKSKAAIRSDVAVMIARGAA